MEDSEVAQRTTQIVAAFAGNNRIPPADLPALIATVHQAIAAAAAPPVEPAIEMPSRASVRRSIQPDRIISFEDGRPYKVLTLHLTARGLTATQYRDKWRLPRDYPMTAPNYATQRSALAKTISLRSRGGAAAAQPAQDPAYAPPGTEPAPQSKGSARKPRGTPRTRSATSAGQSKSVD